MCCVVATWRIDKSGSLIGLPALIANTNAIVAKNMLWIRGLLRRTAVRYGAYVVETWCARRRGPVTMVFTATSLVTVMVCEESRDTKIFIVALRVLMRRNRLLIIRRVAEL